MRALIDLDNTILHPISLTFSNKVITLLKCLTAYKIDIVVYTARPKCLYWITKMQLDKAFKKIGLRYKKLICGKARGDVYIGNNAVNFNENSNPIKVMAIVTRVIKDGKV